MDFETLISVAGATLRLSAPLLLACMAGLYAERSGVFDIGLEGKMLSSAFAAATVATWSHSMVYGVAAGILISTILAMLHGLASITLRGNQIISGVAINFLAQGMTVVLGLSWFAQGGMTPALGEGERFLPITLPFAAGLADIWLIGPIYSRILSGNNLLVYVAFILVPVTAWVLYRSRFGLRLRAVGENPKAVDTAGISVSTLRYQALAIDGVLCGIAGAYLSIAQGSGFGINMTAGKGYIALAALIFAKWKPLPAMFSCLLFGFLDASQIRLQGAVWPIIGAVPVQLVQALPYLLTVFLLAGFLGKSAAPKAGGIPYLKER